MKEVTWMLLILFFPFSEYAQSAEIKWGETTKEKGMKYNNLRPIGHTDNHYYIFNQPKKNHGIFQYDFNHQLKKYTTLNLDKNIKVHQIINTSSGNYLLCFNENKKGKNLTFYSSKINVDESVNTNINQIFTSNSKNTAFLNPKIDEPVISSMLYQVNNAPPVKDQVGIFLSNDRTKVLYANTKYNQEKGKPKGNEKYHIVVLNDHLEKIWERNFEFPFSAKRVEVKQLEVTNSGEVYILAAIKLKKIRKGILPKSDFAIYKVTEDNELSPIILQVDGVYPSHAMIYPHTDGNLFVNGFFIQKGTSKLLRQHGVFMTKYDVKGNEVFQKTELWDDDFYTQLKKEFKIKKKGKGSLNTEEYDLRIGDIHIDNENKSIIFVSDYLLFRDNKSGIRTCDTRQLIIPSFSFSGEHRWTTCINKRSTTSIPGIAPLDYFSVLKDGKIYLIYEDEKTTKELKSVNLKGKQTADFIDMAIINSDGKIDHQVTIFNSKETKANFRPRSSKYLGNDLVLLDGGGYKLRVMGVFSLPNTSN